MNTTDRIRTGKGLGWKATVLGTLLMGLAACSPGSPPLATPPTFSGPWSAEFRDAYDSATNPAARTILEDGTITDAEIAELRGQEITCLENLGCTVTELNPDGSAFITPPQQDGDTMDDITARTNELRSRCDTETDWPSVASLYTWSTKNPSHQATESLMAECLIRVGLEPEGYTPDQYIADLASGVFVPYLEDQTTPDAQRFLACNDDPSNAHA